MTTLMAIPVSIAKRFVLASIFCSISVLSLAAGNDSAGNAATKLAYPDSPRSDQVDDYHGEKVADPYRWLEDLDSAETKTWVEAENKLTFSYLEQIPQ